MSTELADRVGAKAAGALACQRFVDDMRNDRAIPAEAPERFRQLVIEWGADSEAVTGWLVEISKRAR